MSSNNHVIKRFKKPSHLHEHCIAQALTVAESQCARKRARLTTNRRRVLELIWRSHEPVKAYELINDLNTAAPPTVYRALEFLVDMGLVHRIESLNAFVGCGEPQHKHPGQFLICCRCGDVAELDDPEISRLLTAKARSAGFKVAGQTVEIAGVCSNCEQGRNE